MEVEGSLPQYYSEKTQSQEIAKKAFMTPERKTQSERSGRRPDWHAVSMWEWLKDVGNRRLTSWDYRQPLAQSRAARAAEREAARVARESAQAEARREEIGRVETQLAQLQQRYVVLFGHEDGDPAVAEAVLQDQLSQTQASYEQTLGLTDKNAETSAFGSAISEAEGAEVTKILHDFDQEELTVDGSESWNATVRMAQLLPEAQRLLVEAEMAAAKLSSLQALEGQEQTSPAWLADLRAETEALVERAPAAAKAEAATTVDYNPQNEVAPGEDEQIVAAAGVDYNPQTDAYPDESESEVAPVTVDYSTQVSAQEQEAAATLTALGSEATGEAAAQDYVEIMDDAQEPPEEAPAPEVESDGLPSVEATLAELVAMQKKLAETAGAQAQESRAAQAAAHTEKLHQMGAAWVQELADAKLVRPQAEKTVSQAEPDQDDPDAWRAWVGEAKNRDGEDEKNTKVKPDELEAKTEINTNNNAVTSGEDAEQKPKINVEAGAEETRDVSPAESQESEKPLATGEYRQYLTQALWTYDKLLSRVSEAAEQKWSVDVWQKKMKRVTRELVGGLVYGGTEEHNDPNLKLKEKRVLIQNQLLALMEESRLYDKLTQQSPESVRQWLANESRGWEDRRGQFRALVCTQAPAELEALWAGQRPEEETSVDYNTQPEAVEQPQPGEESPAETARGDAVALETSVDYSTHETGESSEQSPTDVENKIFEALAGKIDGAGVGLGKRFGRGRRHGGGKSGGGKDGRRGSGWDYADSSKDKNPWKDDRRKRYDAEMNAAA